MGRVLKSKIRIISVTSIARLLSAVFLLLSTLLPVQQVFACDMMGGMAKVECCCDKNVTDNNCISDGCEQDAQISLGKAGCCDVSLSEPAVYTAQHIVTHTISVADLIEPPLPPPALLHSQLQLHIATSTSPVIDHHDIHTGNQTFLLTQRLRI